MSSFLHVDFFADESNSLANATKESIEARAKKCFERYPENVGKWDTLDEEKKNDWRTEASFTYNWLC